MTSSIVNNNFYLVLHYLIILFSKKILLIQIQANLRKKDEGKMNECKPTYVQIKQK